MSSMVVLKCFIVEDNETITHGGLTITGARRILSELRQSGRQLTIHQGNKVPGATWKPDDEARYPTVGP